MKVSELKSTLKGLSELYRDSGDHEKAAGLLKLSEVLADKHGEQKVDRFLGEIRSRRGLRLN